MRNLLLFILLSLSAQQTFASESAKSYLVEFNTRITWAPPEELGIHKFQILVTGEIQQVDNSGHVTKLANLESDVVEKLRRKIDKIEPGKLQSIDGPICNGGPSSRILVQNSTGSVIEIWKKISCIESLPIDPSAARVAEIIKNLAYTFSSLNDIDD